MNNEIKSFFRFSKKELNGILVLLTIIIPILLLPELVKMVDDPPIYDFTESKLEIEKFLSDTLPIKTVVRSHPQGSGRSTIATYFKFDPNLASEVDWIKLGLSERQIKVILNYRSRGGKFYTKSDLRKIYSISEDLYQKLEPYIVISSMRSEELTKYSKLPTNWNKQKALPAIVEINTADSAQFEALSGIGPVFASRIIKFRNKVGGFHGIDQLQDVYGIDSVLYQKILPFLRVEPSLIIKIQINTVTPEELRSRTFLSYKQINAIIQYRKQHGSFNNTSDLLKVELLNEEIIRKIEPYLAF